VEIDECGVCGGPGFGCTEENACNFEVVGCGECYYGTWADGSICYGDWGPCLYDCNGDCDDYYFYDSTGDGLDDCCGYVEERSFDVQVAVSMQPWEILDWISDEENYFGTSNAALDDYDSMDIPDPPVFDTNWIKAYFYLQMKNPILDDKNRL
jgi:hypothetical protein